jgi:hypothetical protein
VNIATILKRRPDERFPGFDTYGQFLLINDNKPHQHISYQLSERPTLPSSIVMTGHRAGHLSPHVLTGMTASVAGHGGVGQCFGRLVSDL